jgi:hypothetical protein
VHARRAVAEVLFARWKALGPTRIVVELTEDGIVRGLPQAFWLDETEMVEARELYPVVPMCLIVVPSRIAGV